MKRRVLFAGVLMIVCALAAFAQNRKSNMAVLPFTGGQGNEGETVAELFSYNNQLMTMFGIIPRTSITRAVEQEQEFQTSGMTDADTIAAIGAQLGAQYVIAGSITALGGQKLLVVTIIKIETVQQVAGDYLMYTTEEELDGKIPIMVQNLLPMLEVDTNVMEKLAVLPIQLGSGASAQDADTLAQILSIALMRNRSYAIYPRTASLEQVQQEFNTQYSGVTDDQQVAQLGRAENPKLVLSVAARELGASNRFNASIINLEDGTQVQGTSEVYANMSDGILAMDIIARNLSGQDISAADQRRRTAELSSVANRQESARRRAEASERFYQKARMLFAFQLGISFIPKSLIGERIFGEPASEFVTGKSKAEDGSSTTTTTKDAPLRVGVPLDLLLGFQYSWLSINSGVSVGIKFHGPSQMEYTFLQVPVLLRGDWLIPNTSFGINAFAGLGINIPVTATVALADVEYGNTTSYKATLTIPPSVILGVGLGANIFYMDARFVFDIGDAEAKLADARIGKFSRTSIDLVVGLRYRMSFSKSNK
jgi:TolB-like protein